MVQSAALEDQEQEGFVEVLRLTGNVTPQKQLFHAPAGLLVCMLRALSSPVKTGLGFNTEIIS